MIDPVTIRWSDALFNLAQRAGALDDVQRDLSGLHRQIEAHPEVFDARLSLSERRAKLEPHARGVHPLLQNLIGLAFDRRRADVLRGLSRAFERRLQQERGQAAGVAESARALGVGELAELAVTVGKLLGKDVRLQGRVVPALLGGVRVLVENHMLDDSLQGRLEGLRKKMVDAPLASRA
jgi:F-type H+-transporting ATPase subunit delta